MSQDEPAILDRAAGEGPARPSSALGVSFLLPAVAVWLVLGGFWIQYETYERFRGRTDLDMPEWFAINVNVTFQVLPLALIASFLNMIAVVLIPLWARKSSWLLRV